ncbi:Two-component response regulator ARR8 [Hibiscus syriacus]|uniref:Two-component response regulator ARR8 n=1 Tax=Hibiscus syriacus TaxID=106335 RepID=A0A6A2YZE0_HIBSY|nr:Two-component response regulator ARR8 [Hibiscus syriacus]
MFTVTAVDSGTKALEFLGLNNKERDSNSDVEVNLIITDYCMPGMSGHDLLRKVKGCSSLKDIPVVIMSSDNIPSRINRCLEDGAEEFFLKPVQLSDVNKLRPHLMKSRCKPIRNKRKAAEGIASPDRTSRYSGIGKMASLPKSLKNCTFVFLFIIIFCLSSAPLALAQCEPQSRSGCRDKEESMKLKIITFVTILLSSTIGVSLPLCSRHILSLKPDTDLFVVVKRSLRAKFLFTTFLAMLSVVSTLMVDLIAMSLYKKHHGHVETNNASQQLLRHRVVAQYKLKMKAIMVVFFSSTTPLGIALGIGLSRVYSATSPTALIVVGLLNACSAGLLNYMALVDLLAADFLGPNLQTNMKLQAWSYVAVLLGAGFMYLMAKWA